LVPGCEMDYKFSYLLKDHLKTHNFSGENFDCHICELKFNRYSTLSIHVKIHSTQNAKGISPISTLEPKKSKPKIVEESKKFFPFNDVIINNERKETQIIETQNFNNQSIDNIIQNISDLNNTKNENLNNNKNTISYSNKKPKLSELSIDSYFLLNNKPYENGEDLNTDVKPKFCQLRIDLFQIFDIFSQMQSSSKNSSNGNNFESFKLQLNQKTFLQALLNSNLLDKYMLEYLYMLLNFEFKMKENYIELENYINEIKKKIPLNAISKNK